MSRTSLHGPVVAGATEDSIAPPTAPAFTPGCGAGCGKSHAPPTPTPKALESLRAAISLRVRYLAEADVDAPAVQSTLKEKVPDAVISDLTAVWAAARDPDVRAFCVDRLELLELGFKQYKLLQRSGARGDAGRHNRFLPRREDRLSPPLRSGGDDGAVSGMAGG